MNGVDPIFSVLTNYAFAAIFLLAGLHKLKDRAAFSKILEGYGLVPLTALSVVVAVIPMLELSAGLIVGLGLAAGKMLVAVLVGLYTIVLASMIVRGKTDIDCGCGWATTDSISSGDGISWVHIFRNSILIAITGIWLLPKSDRVLTVFDHANAGAFVIACGLLFIATINLKLHGSSIGARRP